MTTLAIFPRHMSWIGLFHTSSLNVPELVYRCVKRTASEGSRLKATPCCSLLFLVVWSLPAFCFKYISSSLPLFHVRAPRSQGGMLHKVSGWWRKGHPVPHLNPIDLLGGEVKETLLLSLPHRQGITNKLNIHQGLQCMGNISGLPPSIYPPSLSVPGSPSWS